MSRWQSVISPAVAGSGSLRRRPTAPTATHLAATRCSSVTWHAAATAAGAIPSGTVSQARVSQLESGDLSHTELGTLQSYVAALGGELRVVADFGENSLHLLDG